MIDKYELAHAKADECCDSISDTFSEIAYGAFPPTALGVLTGLSLENGSRILTIALVAASFTLVALQSWLLARYIKADRRLGETITYGEGWMDGFRDRKRDRKKAEVRDERD